MAQLQETFRDNLRRLLREKRMTQRDLAKLLETSDASISELINGNYSPTLKMVERVSSALRTNSLALLVPLALEEISGSALIPS